MAHKYVQIAFTDTVREVQSEHNSRAGYSRMDQGEDYNHLLSQQEADFLAERDSFYMASVSETSWPYVQHRGGPKGFMRVLDESTIGFADFSGNRQYVSTGNFRINDRVSLFFMDYPNRRRLKMMGRIEQVADTDWETLAKLESADYRATIERGFLIHVEGFDWNCPQHITPRFSEAEVEQTIAPLIAENRALKAAQLEARQVNDRTSFTQPLGQGELPLVISGIRQLTPRVRAYELSHRDGLPLPQASAGAHLRVPVLSSNGETGVRHYSITSNPARDDIFEIAVLREEEGEGGSLFIHEHYQLGQVLNCEPVDNYFELHVDERPALLIAGGIGITPIKAMVHELQDRDAELTLHYAGRSLNEMAFQAWLQKMLPGRVRLYSADQSERLDLQAVLADAPADTVFYGCGPQRLMDAFEAAAVKLNIPRSRVRLERFNAAQAPDAQAITVQLARSNKTIHVEPDQSILDAALEAGIDAPYSCKTGNCKSCAVKVIDGRPQHLDNALSDDERTQRLMCPCVSRSLDDRLVLDL